MGQNREFQALPKETDFHLQQEMKRLRPQSLSKTVEVVMKRQLISDRFFGDTAKLQAYYSLPESIPFKKWEKPSWDENKYQTLTSKEPKFLWISLWSNLGLKT